jgi:hypothetical protein
MSDLPLAAATVGAAFIIGAALVGFVSLIGACIRTGRGAEGVITDRQRVRPHSAEARFYDYEHEDERDGAA